ncbi:MAG: T9SS type A sorting domain-containing protein [Leptolyngbya sp. SIO1D8]|nr:T9SS type A sorting domain-containing protein [Leptolyngbya sp. SIO1D8]
MGPQPTDIGYRKRLFESLSPVYPGLQFVGSESNGDGSGFDQDHEGHSGWRADEIRDNIYLTGEDWLTNHPPDVILLHIGTNDIGAGENLTNIVSEVEDILNRIDQYESDNNTEVVVFVARIIRLLFGAFDGSETTDYNNQIATMVNQRIANGDQLFLVDQEPSIVYPGGLPDEIHPDQTGYNSMADVWELAINSTLATPQITNPGILTASAGSNFQYQIEASGVPTPTISVNNLPPGMTFDPGTWTVSWTPNESQEGPASFDVIATNVLGTDNETININVELVNDPPVFIKGPDIVIDEDSGPQEFLNWATGIDDGDSELTQNVSFNIVSVNSSNSHTLSPSISPSGDLTFTPGDDVNGVFTVTISLTDDGTPAETSAEQTFTITINPVNDPPTFTLSEDNLELFVGFEATEVNALPAERPLDEVSQIVTYSLVPSSVDFVDISIDDTGKISINPKPENNIGEQEFAVIANDGQSVNNTHVVSFMLSVNLAVGIEDELQKSIKTYPNPVDNTLNVQLENTYLGPVSLQLYDLSGGVVKSETFLKTTTLTNRAIDVNQIKSGLYLIKLQLDGNEVWNKIIVE